MRNVYATRVTLQVKELDIDTRKMVKTLGVFNWTPHHQGVLGMWMYSSTHS